MGRRAHLRLAAAVPPAGPRLRTQARSPRGHGVLGHHHDYDKAPGQIRNRNSPGQTVGRRPQPSLTETRSTGRMTTFIYRLSGIALTSPGPLDDVFDVQRAAAQPFDVEPQVVSLGRIARGVSQHRSEEHT